MALSCGGLAAFLGSGAKKKHTNIACIGERYRASL